MKSCRKRAAQLEKMRGLVLSWLALVQAEKKGPKVIFLLWSYFPCEAPLEFLIENQVEVCMFGCGITKGSEHLHPLGSSHTSLAETYFLSTKVFLLKNKACKQCSQVLNTPKAFPNADIGFAWQIKLHVIGTQNFSKLFYENIKSIWLKMPNL